jgi:hypothetical protein
MTINGIDYHSDLIITPSKIIDDWWRKSGHNLTLEDLPGIDWSILHTVFIGTGWLGLMNVDQRIFDLLEEHEIAFVIKPTPIAVKEFNRSIHDLKLGLFHLTC